MYKRQLLDQVESLSDLGRDAMPILNDAVAMSVQQLDALERRGYFRLLKEGQYVLDNICLLYTSDAADERSSVDLGGRRIIKKKTQVSELRDLHRNTPSVQHILEM